MYEKPKMPKWMHDLPNNATIGSLEMCEIYGCSRTNMSRFVERGTLPPPVLKTMRDCGMVKFRWNVGEIRKHVRLMNMPSSLTEDLGRLSTNSLNSDSEAKGLIDIVLFASDSQEKRPPLRKTKL